MVAVTGGLFGWGVLKVHHGGPDSAVPVPQRQLLVPRADGLTVTATDPAAVSDLATVVFTTLTFP